MLNEELKLEFDGSEIRELYPDLLGIDVELAEEIAGLARIRVALTPEPDGGWRWLDDERLATWRSLRVSAGFDEPNSRAAGLTELFDGFIVRSSVQIALDPTESTLELLAFDRSILLDREDTIQAWPNKKDSDIAREICQRYGLSVEIDDTPVVHDETLSTIMQRESDARFLRYLANRNGFEFFVSSGKAHFRKPRIDAPPQPVLAAHFETETTLLSFQADVNALAATAATGVHFDRVSKAVTGVEARSNGERLLGGRAVDAARPGAVKSARVQTDRITTTGPPELEAIVQNIYRQGQWSIIAHGVVDANAYGHVLEARRPVTIKGVGSDHSGVYYVRSVTHYFDREGYTQAFRAGRNALQPTGREVFRV